MGVHDHPVGLADVDTGRCRLCTANDIDAVIEQLAADLWESRDGRPWAECGSHWQRIFRDFAATAVESLRSSQAS